MAEVKKKSKKKVAPKKLSAAKKKKKQALPYQTVTLILFAAAILAGIFTYLNTNAVVAVFFHDIFFGLFAKTAWLIPIMTGGLGIYTVKQKSSSGLKAKSILLFVFAICIAALIHTIADNSIPVPELYGYGVTGVGGGLLGGLLSKGLVGTIGMAAAIVVLIFAIIMLMSLILQISVVTAVSSFISGLMGMREEIEPQKSDKYEQGRKVKKKIEKTSRNHVSENYFVQVMNFPKRKFILKRGIEAKNYFEYVSEVGCEVWGLLCSIIEAINEPIGVWLPKKFI